MALTRQKVGPGIDCFHIAHEIRYPVTRPRVWEAITRAVNDWWPHRTLATERPWINHVTLEPRTGGHFKERWSDGEGALWATVVQIEHGKLLRMTGPLGMLSQPVVSHFCFDLKDIENGGTLLSLTHDCFGMLDDGWADQYHARWSEALDVYLRAWLEEGKSALILKAEAWAKAR